MALLFSRGEANVAKNERDNGAWDPKFMRSFNGWDVEEILTLLD